MKYHHNTLKQAYHFLIEKRPQIRPNEGFLLQLLRYESELISENPTEDSQMKENSTETLNVYKTKHEKIE